MVAPPIARLPAKPPFSPHPRPAPERRPAHRPWCEPGSLTRRRRGGAPASHRAGGRRASGTIRERFFYQCLAHHLGAAFIDGEIALGAGARYPHTVHAGLARLTNQDIVDLSDRVKMGTKVVVLR